MTAIEPEIQSLAAYDELLRGKDKAEIINGRIVKLMATGDWPGEVALNIALLLREQVRRTGRGHARGDFVGYAVPMLSSGRQSFAPDASYFLGPLPPNRMRFVQGPPLFAVEVRSESDYGPVAERELSAKRRDYFEAGTQVVWDVDPINRRIFSYHVANPEFPRLFKAGQIADAEPAIPGWRVTLDAVFESQ